MKNMAKLVEYSVKIAKAFLSYILQQVKNTDPQMEHSIKINYNGTHHSTRNLTIVAPGMALGIQL